MLITGTVFLDGKSSEFFPIKQRATQGCTSLPALFLIHINGQLCEIEKWPQLGVKFSKYKLSSSLLFADDFVRVAEIQSAS